MNCRNAHRPGSAGCQPALPGRRSQWFAFLATLLLVALLTSGCRVEEAMTSSLPAVAGTERVTSTLSQAFAAPADGLNGLTIGIAQQPSLSGDSEPSLTEGATVQVQYAPEADPRFPEPAFHDWPGPPRQDWLGELTGSRVIGQSFVSPYPNLNGITLRVATFGGDLSAGQAELKAGPAVPVLALPIDGKQIASLPGGSSVQVSGGSEGWAQVALGQGQAGYVDLTEFAKLPPPARVNDKDVVLTVYEEPGMRQVRRSVLNARQIHDNSHVTFSFAPLADSLGKTYRFTLTSPESTPGNAVTFRYWLGDVYHDGNRYEGNAVASGALDFKPTYDSQTAPLYSGSLDKFGWSAPEGALVGSFAPLNHTAGRYLKLVIKAGKGPIDVTWSMLRPPGGRALSVPNDPAAPGGGLVFNTGYRAEFPLGASLSQALAGAGHAARRDPAFFALYGLLAVLCVGWWVSRLAGWRLPRGR